jgi:hypothetical protein
MACFAERAGFGFEAEINAKEAEIIATIKNSNH